MVFRAHPSIKILFPPSVQPKLSLVKWLQFIKLEKWRHHRCKTTVVKLLIVPASRSIEIDAYLLIINVLPIHPCVMFLRFLHGYGYRFGYLIVVCQVDRLRPFRYTRIQLFSKPVSGTHYQNLMLMMQVYPVRYFYDTNMVMTSLRDTVMHTKLLGLAAMYKEIDQRKY